MKRFVTRLVSGSFAVYEENMVGLEDIAEDACPFCVQEVGTHDHVFWRCQYNVPLTQIPDNYLQLSFGWPVLGNPHNLRVATRLSRSIEELWELQHPTS